MNHSHDTETIDSPAGRPLVVDMDGSLVATDTLWESVLLLLKDRPLTAFLLPLWLYGGKVKLKREIARRVTPDPAALPYNTDVLRFLKEEHRRGRQLVLATASNHAVAERVAGHLQIFSAVLASDDAVNLRGTEKLRAVRACLGANQAFDYIGDSADDLVMWDASVSSHLVRPSRRLEKRVRKTCTVDRVFDSGAGNRFDEITRALRIHQWSKNLLLFVPLLLAHRVTDIAALSLTALAFLSFSLCASAVYVVNDLLDLPYDRIHPVKRRRPFAAGTLPIEAGVFLAIFLVTVGLGGAILILPREFVYVLSIYIVSSTAYSLFIKRLLVLDVVVLAGLYALRVLAGGVVAEVPISQWLVALSAFFFLSLALLKRYSEIVLMQQLDRKVTDGRGYRTDDSAIVLSFGATSGLLSVLVFALYITSDEVIRLYASPQVLWLVGPPLLYWIMMMWVVAHRGELDSDPIVYTVTDRTSYVIAAIVAALTAAAAVWKTS